MLITKKQISNLFSLRKLDDIQNETTSFAGWTRQGCKRNKTLGEGIFFDIAKARELVATTK